MLLLAVYGLSYSGRFSTDDEHILASRSLSLASQGQLNDDRVMGNDRIFYYESLPGVKAAQSLGIEPLQSVLGAGLVRLALLLNNGRVQTLFLLNIFATALTAVCVFAAVRGLDYPDRTALVTALLFGLGTQVWPYTKSLFRDPLAMLFLAAAWACAIQLNRSQTRAGRWASGLGVAFALILGILSKNTVVIAVPFVALFLVPFWRSLFTPKKGPRPWIILGILVALGLFLAILLSARGALARFNLGYYWQLLVFFLTTPHPHLLQALFGPLVSPGKSIFLFSPLLFLSAAALLKGRGEALAAWGYLLLLILFQALFYDEVWWGNVNWGLRFLTPAMPLLMVGSAAVIHRLLNARGGWVWIVFLGCLSGLIQLAGISASLVGYYLSLMDISPAAAGTLGVWSPAHSALVWNSGWILAGHLWDLAVLRAGLPGLLFALALVALPALAWFGLRRQRPSSTLALAGVLIVVILLMPGLYRNDPDYFPARQDFKQVRLDLIPLALPADQLVIGTYGAPAWDYWMNWGLAEPAWTSLPFSLSMTEVSAPTLAILASTADRSGRLWLLLPCDSSSSEVLLAQKDRISFLQLAEERTYQDGGCKTSLLLFTPR